MNSSLSSDSEEIAAIQLQIDWMEYIAKELAGHNFVPELVLLEQRKMMAMKKIVAEEIAKKYADLALARVIRHTRAKRKVIGNDEKGKRFKKITSESLRMTLGLNKMKMKAMELPVAARSDEIDQTARRERKNGKWRIQMNIIEM